MRFNNNSQQTIKPLKIFQNIPFVMPDNQIRNPPRINFSYSTHSTNINKSQTGNRIKQGSFIPLLSTPTSSNQKFMMKTKLLQTINEQRSSQAFTHINSNSFNPITQQKLLNSQMIEPSVVQQQIVVSNRPDFKIQQKECTQFKIDKEIFTPQKKKDSGIGFWCCGGRDLNSA